MSIAPQATSRPSRISRSPAPASGPAGTMRVLHAITPSRMAGAETFLARLLNHAKGGRIEHRCLVNNDSPAINEMRAAGIDFAQAGIGGKVNLLAVSRLARAAREAGASLIDSHLSTASWWCCWLERCGGIPTVGHVHGFTSAHWHRGQSHLVTCSHAVKEDLIEKGFDAGQITALHVPVEPADVMAARSRRDVRQEFGVDDDTPVVGTFAHLSVKKGHRELIVAAEQVLREMPNAQFWCFGDGLLREELTAKADELGISDRFRLMGFRRDVPDMMRAVDVMALPSHREPFGLVYVEAGLCDRPVIACQAGGAPEIIEHAESGLLVPPMSPGKLAEAILELLGDRTRAEKMGRRGNEICRTRFNWPNYVEQLSQVYEQVVEQFAR
ncbi:glycosyltransferase [Aeoliella mucimassa]|uniref:Alpha-D-kanosaminyltransferase n=1 Tax=Aeoliella mucimassa TaxID=2527972 RepID=A0A518AVM2_9BACT|nr:glycosyltransferase [Aeoliella mucimassa]QDU58751.1 Alpha-D-kanosaminyltransferase [Aeoliella mucimassa]